LFDADFKSLEESLARLSGLVEADAQALGAERERMAQRARWLTPLLLVGTVTLMVGFGLPFANRILRRLGAEPQALSALAAAVARGDLHASLSNTSPPAGSVADSMMRMRDRLREAVADIRASADTVASGSQQIRSANEHLAQRTEDQAQQLQSTSGNMDEIHLRVQQTAHSAATASRLADGAGQMASAAGLAVGEVVNVMDDIQDSGQRIAAIVAVIDGLALQTNILALNAAVEASRAREHGSGFAVVAAEVRALAQRSAQSAREIQALVDHCTETISNGHQRVNAAGQAMQQLQQRVDAVKEQIVSITAAAVEQTQGIGVVNAAVTTLDGATQDNASMVEQSAVAAGVLAEQAQRLADAVSMFKLESAQT
jgi:methyl-accepting chemotaxis protein